MMKKIIPLLLAALLLCGCQQKAKSPYSDELMILEEASVYTMSDGTVVNRWSAGTMEQDLYCIPDELNEHLLADVLVIDHPKGPEGVKNDGLCFDDLPEAAKSVIGSYYEQQGLLYDPMEELVLACEDYLVCKDEDKTYEFHYLNQVVWPTGATEELIAFCTELVTYHGEKDVRQDWYNVIFDRNTGEQISVESLFSVPLEEAKAVILDALMPEKLERDEKHLRQQMEEAFSFDYIKLMNDGIEVMFPVDTLECKEKAFGNFIPAEELKGILDIWSK